MIEVRDLSKVYGDRVAVWKIDFRVAKGEIVGFLGPNGAGKTTTMRMITGFIPPSEGTAVVDGCDVTRVPLEVKRKIGYLCEAPPLYREMSVTGYLRFVAELKRVPRNRRKPCVDRAIQLCGLSEVSRRVVGNLSKGYRQRVGLAQAILHEPSVLILDEPTVGLDPTQIIEIRKLIQELAGEQTVILSTHILPEVTKTCSRVIIINEGQIVAQDQISNLEGDLGALRTVKLRVARPSAELDRSLLAVDGVRSVDAAQDGSRDVRFESRDDVREQVARAVVESGAGLLEMVPQVATLEQVFLTLVTVEDRSGDGDVAA